MNRDKELIQEAWDAFCKVRMGATKDAFMDEATFKKAVEAIDTARRYGLELGASDDEQQQ